MSEYAKLHEQERLIFSATELIETLMRFQGMSRADLAREMDVTRGHITQSLSGNRNMTLRTLADFAYALDHRIELEAVALTAGDRAGRRALLPRDALLVEREWLADLPGERQPTASEGSELAA